MYLLDCNHYWNNMLRQQKFLTSLVERMDIDSEWEVIYSDIEKVRTLMTSPSNIVIHMGANLGVLSMKYANVLSPWDQLSSKDIGPVKER